MNGIIPDRKEIELFLQSRLCTDDFFDVTDGMVRIDNAGTVTLKAYAYSVSDMNRYKRHFRDAAKLFGCDRKYDLRVRIVKGEESTFNEVELSFETLDKIPAELEDLA